MQGKHRADRNVANGSDHNYYELGYFFDGGELVAVVAFAEWEVSPEETDSMTTVEYVHERTPERAAELRRRATLLLGLTGDALPLDTVCAQHPWMRVCGD